MFKRDKRFLTVLSENNREIRTMLNSNTVSLSCFSSIFKNCTSNDIVRDDDRNEAMDRDSSWTKPMGGWIIVNSKID